MQKGRVNILIDGQWGSTGKGKLAGYLANRNEIDLVAAFTSPNAGHTYISGDTVIMLKQLPSAAINRNSEIVITPQCVINPERLLLEADMLKCLDRLTIHPHAAVVTDEHRKREQDSLARISSTLQGTGAALASRVMREEFAVAKSCKALKPFLGDTSKKVEGVINGGGVVFLEMSQGFDLSLTWGHSYPYTTSRDVTTAAGLNAVGVNPRLIGDVYGSIRTYPIRVGHAYTNNSAETGEKIGDSGPCYDDQEELTWEQITKMSKSPDSLLERTTVTNKVRRIFTFSMQQMKNFMRICGPTHMFVNFVNYWDHAAYGVSSWDELSESVQWQTRQLQMGLQDLASGAVGTPVPRVALLGTGPDDSAMVEVEN
jgi:adenylosuccinate synthase